MKTYLTNVNVNILLNSRLIRTVSCLDKKIHIPKNNTIQNMLLSATYHSHPPEFTHLIFRPLPYRKQENQTKPPVVILIPY